MATKKKTRPKEKGSVSFAVSAAHIDENDIVDEMESSFLEYAYSVITDRALVDARDGLKPVHRRILFSMFNSGFLPDRAYVKAAKVVGDVMGNYHPHGDSSIYGSLVGITQDFNMMLPLADGHGNWGSPDDGPAAPRYTETRLDANSLLLTNELKEKVVDLEFNYDGTLEMPEVLPVQYPNTLINGQTGIAVGMATNMATHNPSEIMDAARWLLTHPGATLDKLMEFVPGPDFPTGGTIIGTDKIRDAYETGRGTFKIRGHAEIESGDRGKSQVVVTELPYGVGAEKVIEKAVELVRDQKLLGISNIQNLTDRRQGMRIVFVVKAGVNPNVVLNALYAMTPLEVGFSINNVCLVKGQPQTLGLKELLQIFLDHRLDIVMRRSINRRQEREKSLHRIEGLLKALVDIDKVIKIIRGAEDTEVARTELVKKFKVDTIQADYILSLQLRSLTKFDQIKLSADRDRLKKEIAELTEIIENDSVLRKLVGDELTATKKIIDRPRSSIILGGNIAEHLEEAKTVAQSMTLEVEDAAVQVAVFADGSVRRVESGAKIKSFSKGGKLSTVVDIVPARTRGKIVLVSNKGRGFRIDALHIADKPTDAKSIVSLANGERIIALAPVEDKEADVNSTSGVGFFFATKNGTVKITKPDYPKRSDEFSLFPVASGDEIVTARWVENLEGAEVALLTTDSSLLRFPAEKVSQQGFTGGGVAGIKLAEDSHVLSATLLSALEVEKAVVITSTGQSMKVSPFNLYPAKGRATGGVRSHRFVKGEEVLTGGAIAVDPIAVDPSGSKIELPAVDSKRDNAGVKMDATVAFVGCG
jgi:DNA gyrase subunit A